MGAVLLAAPFRFIAAATPAATGEPGKGLFLLNPLPYPENALSPFISANTIEFHFGKHQQAYVNKTNELVAHGIRRRKS